MLKKLLSKFIKNLYSIFWNISFFIEAIKMKIRFYNRADVRSLSKGNGEMFKFIITFYNGNCFLIKKINLIGEFWLKIGNIFATDFITNHKSFSEMAPVLYKIKNSKLKKFTLIEKINIKRKEYWQIFFNQVISDIDYESKAIKKQTELIINNFSRSGLISKDHKNRNFIMHNGTIYIIDLETFEFNNN